MSPYVPLYPLMFLKVPQVTLSALSEQLTRTFAVLVQKVPHWWSSFREKYIIFAVTHFRKS